MFLADLAFSPEAGEDGEQANALPPKTKHNYLDLLIQKTERSHRSTRHWHRLPTVLAAADRRWPFIEFGKQLDEHLGRSGGLSAFRTAERESLQKVLPAFEVSQSGFTGSCLCTGSATFDRRNRFSVATSS